MLYSRIGCLYSSVDSTCHYLRLLSESLCRVEVIINTVLPVDFPVWVQVQSDARNQRGTEIDDPMVASAHPNLRMPLRM